MVLDPTARATRAEERFRAVVTLLLTVSGRLLLDREFLVAAIRAAGIRRFGAYDEFAEDDGLLLQDPHQLADALLLLARFKIETFLEVGTWSGHTACLMTAFLLRFNPRLQTTCLDPRKIQRESRGLPVTFVAGISDDFRSRRFDLSFIDGDHSFNWVERDYKNVGAVAPICMFHDIDNEDFKMPDPGKFWEQLKKNESTEEFFEFKYPARHFMGIGIRIKQSAQKQGE